MLWEFGDCVLDDALFQLRRRGRAVKIEPKVFNVLLYLARHSGRVVSKQELLDGLWPGEAVSDSVLPRCIAAARRAVGDTRSRQRTIQTVHGRGYCFATPVETRDALEAEPTPPPSATTSPTPKSSDRFVGREAAMTRLRECMGDAAAGRPALALLVGEPGIGKTRTLAELGAESQRSDGLWLAGRCYEGEGAPAYWPWVQILRAMLQGRAPEQRDHWLGGDAAVLAELLPELRQSIPDLPEPRGLEGEQARFRLFESVVGCLQRVAQTKCLLVSLDDLHWADADSLKLFHFVASEVRESAMFLLGTYRDIEVRRTHPLKGVLGDLARLHHCQRIGLRGLEDSEVASLVESIGGSAPGQDLVNAVVDMTEGNPFFVREIARLWVDEGRLESDPNSTLTLTLPQGVRDAIGRRMDSLSPECNAALQAAAVLGREFNLPVLEQLVEASGENLLELLGEALAAGVIAEVPDAVGRFSFDHALMQQTLYEEISVPQRVSLHRAAGEALASLWEGRPDAPFAELANHFLTAAASGDIDQAIHFSLHAAERAHALCAYADAARHYERALEVLDFDGASDPARRCDLLIRLGEELWTAGERLPARRILDEAADRAREIGRVDLLARAAIAYRGFGEMGMPPETKTLSLMDEAREALGDQHPALRARLLAQLTGTPPYSNSMSKRRDLAAEAQALATRSGDPEALRVALNARYWACLGPDHVHERLDVAREAYRLAAEQGNRQLWMVAIEAELSAHLILGDIDAANRASDEYDRMAEELRQPIFRFLARGIRASQAMNCGDFERAEILMQEGLEIGRGRVPYAEVLYVGQSTWLQMQRGELDQIAARMEQTGAVLGEGFIGMGALVEIMRAMGARDDEGRRAAQQLLSAMVAEDFSRLEHDEHWMVGMTLLIYLALAFRDREAATSLYRQLLPYRELTICHDLLRATICSVDSMLGILAWLQHDFDLAIEHLENAETREQRMKMRPALLRSRQALTTALRSRDAAGDRSRAENLERETELEATALRCRPFLLDPIFPV